MHLTPRTKLIAASLLLLTIPILAASQGLSASGVARAVLAAAALGGIAWWFRRARGTGRATFKNAPRLHVVQRVGLAQRTGLTLVEVDGKPYLIVHGDGYARIRPARRPAPVRATPVLEVVS